MHRRDFLRALALASMSASVSASASSSDIPLLYRLPRRKGAASLIHLTDCHAQLLPVHHREPDINIGVGRGPNQPGHLAGEALLRHYGVRRGSRLAHALTHLDFVELARRYGKMGGFAHMATLVRMIRNQRQGVMVLDGGDSWQGSATSLWTRGADMVAASKLLGVGAMTGHWEFTYGAERVQELIRTDMHGSIDFLAHNIYTRDFEDRVFDPYLIREIAGLEIGIIGQAYPYTPIANPLHLIPDWTFGIREESLRACIRELRQKGVAAVVLLSHNGLDVDLKLASRVEGLNAILGGHTHDPLARPVWIRNSGGDTLVANGGSNGKFLGVLDVFRSKGRIACDYALMPVFSDLLDADREMADLIGRLRQPYIQSLGQRIAVTDDLLYRRGNFSGTFDELILDCLLDTQQADIALSPGFRWGTALLPGSTITREDVMAQTAITYPGIVTREMSGSETKAALEDIADNLFNSDPYYRQGGDMVRTGGLRYSIAPGASIGHRIRDLRVRGVPVEAGKRYRVASWGSVAPPDGASAPIWDALETWCRSTGEIRGVTASIPRIVHPD